MNKLFSTSSKLNILILAFLIFLVYIVVIITNYARKDKIFSYEVKEGSLAESNIYTGIILRDESIFYSNDTGFIDYFAREGEHLGVGDLIYTIDESGVIDELIGESQGENKLTDADLKSLKYQITDFCSTFKDTEYRKTYDFLYSMDGMVLKLANMNILDKIGTANKNSYSELVKINKATETGYIVYNIDGYESLSINSVTESVFDQATYEKEQLINKSLIDRNEPVYKLITSENWSIVIPITEEKAFELANEGYVKIKFLNNQRTVWAGIKTFQNGTEFYAQLTLNNSVLNYCTDRYIDIELSSKAEKGLKIPLSSIVHKEFFLIPKVYASDDGSENSLIFMRKKFGEDGSITAELVSVEIYSETDEYYYVDDTVLKLGDYLIKPEKKDDSNEDKTSDGASTAAVSNAEEATTDELSTSENALADGGIVGYKKQLEEAENSKEEAFPREYPVSAKGELVGVYNMNKGYADFRQVVILYQNDEYAIVKSNTAYGLDVYDFIVLNAESVGEDDILYD